MYLIDTNIIAEMRKIKHQKANPNITAWLKAVNPVSLHTSIIVMMEIERGIMGKKRKDPIQGENLQRWFEYSVKPTFSNRIIYLNDDIAQICASLHVPNPKPENDAWISATAIYHDFTLVTNNVKDFADMPVKILNPFEFSQMQPPD